MQVHTLGEKMIDYVLGPILGSPGLQAGLLQRQV